MYKIVETDKEISWTVLEKSDDNVHTINPVLTLADEYGGRCQIIEDDHCYVLKLKQSDDSYKSTPYIFKEAHEAIKSLPLLKNL